VLLPLAAHGQTLDHIRASNTLACAAETRPGFAEADDDGTIKGLAVDLCRAVAIAVLGPSGTVHMTLPDSDLEYADIAKGSADLVFLSPTATEEHGLEASLIPGPTVFIDPITAMVPANAPDTLAGKTICLMIGTQAQRAVETRLSGLTPPITRLPFREDVEMLDAYNVGRCDAVVDDATRLADMRQQTGINHPGRRLGQPGISHPERRDRKHQPDPTRPTPRLANRNEIHPRRLRHNAKPQSRRRSPALKHHPTRWNHPSDRDARSNKDLE